MEDKRDKKNELLKRNNSAPDFTKSLIKSRTELLVEMFIQKNNFDLQEYIDSQKILKINIPTSVLKEWYPTPNWKKDVTNMVNQLNSITRLEKGANGSFKYYALISFSKFDDEAGLQLNSDPESLKSFIIDSHTSYTLLDYELTNKFTCSYSHQLYWLVCKHDNSLCNYTLYLTPDEINNMFETKYENKDISKKVILPFSKEIQTLFESGETNRNVTVETDWKVIGKRKQIVGWIIKIQNTDRQSKIELNAIQDLKTIDSIIQEYLPKYKRNILNQVRKSDPELIVALSKRLESFVKSDKSSIENIKGYLYRLLEIFKIQPNKKTPITYSDIKNSSIFEKEEKDNAEGILKWLKCVDYWNNLPTIVPIFKQLSFYSYTKMIESNELTISMPSKATYEIIKNDFYEVFTTPIQKEFPNTKLFYQIRNK